MAAPAQLHHHIGGRGVCGTGGWSEVEDPATGAIVARAPMGGRAEVDAAVATAAAAFPACATAPAERGRILSLIADALDAAREDFAAIEAQDTGKPLRAARGDIEGVVATLRYNAGAADKLGGAVIPLGPAALDSTLLEPLGVTAHVTPWNFPLGMLARSVAPALAAGCTAVAKPAEQTPMSALAFARLAEAAGLPPGVLNVICGDGPGAGAALVAHPGVRGVHFTGSVATGRLVGAAAGAAFTPCVLELGGSNALVVWEDAALDRAIEDVVEGAFDNSGQVCSAISRLILHEAIADTFLASLAAAADRLTLGGPADGADLGPLISAAQRDAAVSAIAEAVAAGARLVTGGERPRALAPALAGGHYLSPTILDGVDPASRVAQDEVFGPVLTVFRTSDEAHALALVNGTPTGLCAGIHTRDLARALRFARSAEAGSVWINGWFLGGQQAPTGGAKASGIGRERGMQGLLNCLRIKNVAIRI
jgi:acyl-CoA reductase-like NAD-dependent aldehyde dehydrogenase